MSEMAKMKCLQGIPFRVKMYFNVIELEEELIILGNHFYHLRINEAIKFLLQANLNAMDLSSNVV